MTIQVSAYPDVLARARALGCAVPTELAVLPRNFDVAETLADLEYDNLAADIRKLLRQAGVRETPVENPGQDFPVLDLKSFEFVAPVIFVGASLMSNNPNMVAVATGVIGNYATDFFKGLPGIGKTTLNIVLQKPDGTCKRVTYEGPVSGITDLPDVLRGIFHND